MMVGFDDDSNDYDDDIPVVFLLRIASLPDQDFNFPVQDICLGVTLY